jgi:hypothetical protein
MDKAAFRPDTRHTLACRDAQGRRVHEKNWGDRTVMQHYASAPGRGK